MAVDYYALPPNSLILVTGANGYIASHVVNILLDLGYKVRGTVRAPKAWLDRYFEQKHGKGRFESVVVPALEEPEAWSEILDDVSGIAHIVRRPVAGAGPVFVACLPPNLKLIRSPKGIGLVYGAGSPWGHSPRCQRNHQCSGSGAESEIDQASGFDIIVCCCVYFSA